MKEKYYHSFVFFEQRPWLTRSAITWAWLMTLTRPKATLKTPGLIPRARSAPGLEESWTTALKKRFGIFFLLKVQF